jgi:hypothetical protein
MDVRKIMAGLFGGITHTTMLNLYSISKKEKL